MNEAPDWVNGSSELVNKRREFYPKKYAGFLAKSFVYLCQHEVYSNHIDLDFFQYWNGSFRSKENE